MLCFKCSIKVILGIEVIKLQSLGVQLHFYLKHKKPKHKIMVIINGTSGNDTLNRTSDNDQITGLAGNDVITGGLWSDKFQISLI